MGCDKDGSETLVKVDGPNQIQPKMDPLEKINRPVHRFKKTYRRHRRVPRRLLRWRVKEVGWEKQMMPEKLPEQIARAETWLRCARRRRLDQTWREEN
jgi:hypothetical protein